MTDQQAGGLDGDSSGAVPVKPIQIRGSRWKALRIAALFLAIGLFGGQQIKDHGASPLIVLSIVAIAALGLLAFYRVFSPGCLTIDVAGLRWSGFGRSWQIGWRQIAGFRIVRYRHAVTLAIDYVGPDPRGAGARPRRPTAIPGMLEIEPRAVRDMLLDRMASARLAYPIPVVVARSIAVLREPAAVIPALSISLAAILTLVFLTELVFPIGPALRGGQPTIVTLMAFGGNIGKLTIGQGQWYRLATAPFLHSSPEHLIFNCIGLLIAGRLLEGLVGRSWFAAIYAVGAVAGGVGTLALNPANVVSVGASGAIMALFGALFVCSLHFERSPARDRLQIRSLVILVSTLLTIGKTADGSVIDFGAHLGGTIAGALIGAVLVWSWKAADERPRGRRLGLAMGVAGGLCGVAALVPATGGYHQFQALAWLTQHGTSQSGQPDARFQSDMQQADTLFSEAKLFPALEQARAAAAIAPNDAGALGEEGDILFALGDVRDAIGSYDAVLKVAPSAPQEFLVRGMARYYASDPKGAIDDLDRAIALDPNNLYNRIWRNIVADRERLAEHPLDDRLTPSDAWPGPIARMFAGWSTPARVAMIADQHRTESSDQICETYVYTGEWDAIHHQPGDGQPMFQLAADRCPPKSIESWAAYAELRR